MIFGIILLKKRCSFLKKKKPLSTTLFKTFSRNIIPILISSANKLLSRKLKACLIMPKGFTIVNSWEKFPAPIHFLSDASLYGIRRRILFLSIHHSVPILFVQNSRERDWFLYFVRHSLLLVSWLSFLRYKSSMNRCSLII